MTMFTSLFPKVVRLSNCSIRLFSNAKKELVWLKEIYELKLENMNLNFKLQFVIFKKNSVIYFLLINFQEENKSRDLQTDLLRLKNNFNLWGALGMDIWF